MGKGRLNLAFLRELRLPETRPPAGESASEWSLSRRELLRLAGAATLLAGLAPASRGAAQAAGGAVGLTSGPGRAAFLLNGEERFVIDVKRFAGLPSLKVVRTPGEIRLTLEHALFPGTRLPADLACTVRTANWTMNLRLALGDIAVDVPLERWLAGEVEARSRVSLDSLALDAAGGTLRLAGAGELTFSPDWVVRIAGPAVARFTAAGPSAKAAALELESDVATVLLSGPGAASLLEAPPDRRTLILMERKGRAWNLMPDLAKPAGWQLAARGQPFDLLRVETSLTARGEMRAAYVAESGGHQSTLHLQTGGGAGREGLRMPLNAPRFAGSLAPDASHQALVASFPREPVWLHADGCSMLVGAGPGVGPFELVNRGGKLAGAACAPALLAVSAPLPGAVTEPVWSGEGTRLSFVPTNPPPEMGQVQAPVDRTPVIILPQNLKLTVVRPDDLLSLTFEFVNLTLQTGGDAKPSLVRIQPKNPAYVIVHFPPQHIGEEAIFENNTGDPAPPAPPIRTRIAGPSRLAFRLSPEVAAIPYTLESLLNWGAFEQSVSATALPPPLHPELVLMGDLPPQRESPEADACNCAPVTPGLMWPPPQVKAPKAPETAIEAPYRVIISPNRYAGWAHAAAPVTHDGRTELWHTRLGVRRNDGTVDEVQGGLRTIRAIWSPDYNPAVPPPDAPVPYLMSLTPNNRHELVALTSDFTMLSYVPMPVRTQRLMLSTLGAWMNVHGTWEPPGALSLEEWRHQAAMARDSYVKVVQKGFLFPLGNRASLVSVTERKFQATPDGKTAAYLRKRQYVVVRQPEKLYPGPGQSYQGRAMPFRKATITTLVTPNLEQAGSGIAGNGQDGYWLRVSYKQGAATVVRDFQFHVIVDDVEGRRHELTMPMAFVSNHISDDGAKMAQVATHASFAGDRRARPMNGQKIYYAPSDQPGDTQYETLSFSWGAEVPDGGLPENQPRFYPIMQQAKVRLSAVEQMSGQPAPADIALHQAYLDHGFDPGANKPMLLARTLSPVPMRLPANNAGGVATPNMDVGGLSKLLGPVGGNPDDFLSGAAIKAEQFLSDEAKILGGILLSSIISDFGLDELGGDGKSAPKITNRVVYPERDGKEDKEAPPIGAETKLVWQPKVRKDPLGLFVPSAGTKLDLLAKLLVKYDSPDQPEYEVRGELNKFKIHLLGDAASFLILSFKELSFLARSGSKLKVTPDIEEVKFDGPLKFIETLREFLAGYGFILDITSAGVKLGYSLALPNVAVGVLALTNMKLSAALTLPFSGDPVRIRFAFCERENPFTLTVSMFGGGGFFAVELGMDKYVLLEAAFEFGGQFAMDIGVASGGVHIMAGIYFKIENDDCTLTGYLRLGGHLSILGLITLSLEFYMGLTYESAHNKVWGEAKLTVKVEILFFSASVELSVRKQFKGSGADPTFAQLMDAPHWDEYCDAFAG